MVIGIIGSTGSIGSRLVRRLIGNGHEVIAVTRSPGKVRKLFGDNVSEFIWDGLDTNALIQLVSSSDVVINLSGENLASGRWTRPRKKLFEESRIGVTQNLAKAVLAAHKKPARIIQMSAIAIYGLQYDGIGKDSRPSISYLQQLTQSWENAIRPVADSGIPVAVMRTAVVLTPEGGMLGKIKPLFRLYLGGHTGSGKQWISWIHHSDLVSAIIYMVDMELEGTYNLCAPGPMTQKNFFRILGKVMKRPSWLHVPEFALNLVYGEMARETVLASQRILPDELLESGFSFRYPDLESALRNILTVAHSQSDKP